MLGSGKGVSSFAAVQLAGLALCILLYAVDLQALEIAGSQAVSGVPGDTVTLSIIINDLTTHPNLSVESLDLNIQYNTAELEFIVGRAGAVFNSGPSPPETIFNDISGLVLSSTSVVPGSPPSEGQELLQLDFNISDTATVGIQRIDITYAYLNEEFEQLLVGTDATDGIITIKPLADGDVNIDGKVDVSDLMLMQQGVLHSLELTTEQIQHGDIAPQIAGTPVPDGVVDLRDLLALQKLVLGL